MNPTLIENQSLLINRATSEADLNILLDSASEYFLTKERAEIIVSRVRGAMKTWMTEASRLQLPSRDIEMFAPRFDKWL